MDTDTPDHRRFRRRSIRKKGHDYTAGTYHVTICIQDRRCLLGDVVHGDMWPNDAGEMINRWWHKLPAKFPGVTLDESVVMPNHFHGIVVLAGTDAPPEHTIGEGRPHGGAPTLGDVMDWFKTMTTNEYIRGVKRRDWPRFRGKLWQRNYHDRIIHDGADLKRVQKYVRDNPWRWSMDVENPQRDAS